VDVIDATSDQAIYFDQHSLDRAFAKLIAKECLVAKGASPWTAASELKFGSPPSAAEYVVAVFMQLDGVVMEIQGTERLHVSHAQSGADVLPAIVVPTTTRDVLPWLRSKLWD